MAVKIKSIGGDSDFLEPGDLIISIDSRPVRDQLDLLFLSESDHPAEVVIEKPGGMELSVNLDPDEFSRLGIVPEPMKFKRCRSRCIFCFVDQMPRGLRNSLYLKDDDYRLSFIYGNYITLNEVKDEDMERIIDYHLSPLYISVHAVDSGVRKQLFGRDDIDDLMEKMNRLAEGEIEFHAQVVLVPGINDGDVLDETVEALFGLYPNCSSVSLVPVGLTCHRDNLPTLRRVTGEESREIIDWADRKRKLFYRETGGTGFLYLADEFYLSSGVSIPEAGYYDDFPQLSNGVGMSRDFIEGVKQRLSSLSNPGDITGSISLITGELGFELYRRYIIPPVREVIPELRIELIPVRNNLFGDTVTVSGLLAGNDIVAAVRERGISSDLLVVPPNAVNFNGIFVDDTSPSDIAGELDTEVVVPGESFLEDCVLEAGRGED